MTCVFVSHVSGEARHRDYTWNGRYGRFIAEDVVAWARGKNKVIQGEDNLICGLSLSGLAATQIALHYSAVFPRVLCQSGSLWWLADKEIAFPATRARFWMSVGDEETDTEVSHPPTGMFQKMSQIEGVQSAVGNLESAGATVRYNLYSGGHAMAPWLEELAAALKWLLDGRETPSA